MKRIGFISSYLGNDGGGVSQVLLDLQHQLNYRSMYEVHSFGAGSPGFAPAASEEKLIHSLEIYRCAGFGYLKNLNAAFMNASIDVAHLHGLWMYTSLFTENLSKKGMPVIISPHGMLDSWAIARSSWKKRAIMYLFERSNLRQARCIHALTKAEAEDIRRILPNVPICVIPNGVELPKINCITKKKPQKRLIYLSRIHPKKCVEELVKAWISISSEAKDAWTLDIYGWGEACHVQSLKNLLSILGDDSNVMFHGPVFGNEKKLVMENASGFILPSLSEGLPMAVLEAWSYELPVIITDQCNMPEAFSRGCAIKVTPSIDQIAKGIQEIISLDDESRYKMGNKGRLLVEEKYTWNHVSELFEQVYAWVLKQGDRPSCVL